MKSSGINTLQKWVALLLAAVSAGCVSEADLKPESQPVDRLSEAPLPALRAGDKVLFASGRSEQVTRVEAGLVSWRRSANTKFTAPQNFLLPPTYYESSKRQVRYLGDAAYDIMWPLRLGETQRFVITRIFLDKSKGTEKSKRLEWRCETEQGERIRIAAGWFDSYRIACSREKWDGKVLERQSWYYSPDLGVPILRIDVRRGKEPRKRELIAFQPSLAMLSSQDQEGLDRVLAESMETLPSGKRAIWRSSTKPVSVEIIPVNSFKTAKGTFCRNYRLEIEHKREHRLGAGIICRDDKKRWRVPKKLIAGTPFFS
ncbi:MAG: hypothetical protein GY696_28790 [Gammaproteobacteria bacterium]|nr:hypothetical protein [Gammaproteobacteria bacterium]